MRKIAMFVAFWFCVSAGSLAAQEKVVVGGSGAMGDAAEALVKAYKQKHPSDVVDHIAESMSTTGGMEGTKVGRLTVGIVGREVNEKEKAAGLVYRPVTRIPVIVGVHKSLPVSGLSEAQVCEIFSGKIKSWKDVGGADGKIVVLGRTKDDNNIEVFKERMSCFKSVQLPPDTVRLVRGTEVLDSLNNRPGTIGITISGSHLMERPNIKALALAGVAPTLDAVKGNKYKYFNEVGFVTMGEPKGAAKRFVDFATSPEGEKILEKHGMSGAK